ncbi:beta-secretase 1 isoform X2 [Procambarus clarkii]|uniref:beta-secretase 1 isoform X2 n=1 Tax=Procambarus clarkii TaxID=6728 RepID=UPI00374485C4
MILGVHQLLMSHSAVFILLCSTIHNMACHPPLTTSSSMSSEFNVLVDTGSSNLAIAGAPHKELDTFYVRQNSSTYVDLGRDVKVIYTQSSWTGHLGRDLAQFPSLPGTVPLVTDMALITMSDNFYVNNSHWQGILGLAFSALAQPQGVVVPWFDGLVTRNHTANTFSLELCGPSMEEGVYHHFGRLFIGSDVGACSLPVVTTPIRRSWFYEVLVVAVGVGETLLSLPCVKYNTDKSIIDSGTSNLQLPSEVFKMVVSELQSQISESLAPLPKEFWSGSEEICWSQDHKEWDAFPNITVHLAYNNNSAFTITLQPQSYLRPAPDVITGTKDCWMLGIDESQTGTVLGAVVLEGLCVTFDRDRNVIGFSESRCGPAITLGEIYNFSDVLSCVYVPSVVDELTVASYVMIGIVVLLSLPLVLAALRWTWKSLIKPRINPELPFLTLDETNT